jgi:protein dithiol:quinone oxidoreductase
MLSQSKTSDWWPKRLFFCQLCLIASMLLMSIAMQVYLYLEPCILCWIQRFLLVFVLMALCCRRFCVHRLYMHGFFSFLHLLFLSLAIFLAWHHIVLQTSTTESLSCLPNWDILLHYYGWSDMLHHFMYASSCANVSWTFLSWSIPKWLLLAYMILLALFVAEYLSRYLPKKDDVAK